MSLVWSPRSILRLVEIEDYIAMDRPETARRFIERLIDRVELLSHQPESGRRVPELPGLAVREWIFGNYRIVYRVRNETVEIVTVFEGHRLFPREDLDDLD